MNAKFCGALFIGKGALAPAKGRARALGCGGRLYRAARCGLCRSPCGKRPSPLFYVLHLFADLFDLVFEGEGGAGDL